MVNSGATLLPVGSLLLCSRATIGEVKIATVPLCTNQGFKSLVCRGDADSEFLYYLILTLKPRLLAKASGSTFLEIGKRDVAAIQIASPPQAEQRAIAEALSDVDRSIETLEALIAKKRAVKQGTMQQLLTSKIRLPGLRGQWSMRRLADCGILRSGNGFPIKFQGNETGDYPFFKVSDISTRGNEVFLENANHWISEPARRTLGAIAFPQGSVVFAKIGAAVFLERKRILSRDSCLDNNMMAFSLTASGHCERFYYYLFLSMELGNLASTTALPSLSGRDIGTTSVSIPPMEEQRAIAAILSDMDEEIVMLERRRDKTRAIKQGMMAELLTGRVRLIRPMVATVGRPRRRPQQWGLKELRQSDDATQRSGGAAS